MRWETISAVLNFLRETIWVRWSDRFGRAGLMLVAAGVVTSASLRSVGTALVLLGFVVNPAAWRWLVSNRVFWLLVLLAAYIVLGTLLAIEALPETHEVQLKMAHKWLNVLLFPAFGWHITRFPKSFWLVGSLFAAGTLLDVLLATGLDPDHLLSGGRFGGTIHKPIRLAFFCAMSILILTCLWPKSADYLRERLGRRRGIFIGVVVFGMASAVFLWGLLASASRGPLLAFAVGMSVFLLLWQKHMPPDWRLGWRAWLLVLLLAGASASLFYERLTVFTERVVAELPSAAPDALEQSHDTTRIRLALWREGLHLWQEKPWLGWGPGSVRPALSRSKNPLLYESGKAYDGLHNAYIEILFCFGIVGALLIGLMVLFLFHAIVRAHSDTRAHTETYIFLVCAITMIMVANITEFQQLNHNGRALWYLIGGMAMAYGWPVTPRDPKAHEVARPPLEHPQEGASVSSIDNAACSGNKGQPAT